MIYADNAATTKMSRTAIDAMLPYLEESFGNPSSLYALGQRAAEALQTARERVAACGTVLEAWYPLGHGDAGLLNEPVFTQLAQKYGKTNA